MVKGVRGRAANLLECGGLVPCLEQYADDLAVRGYRLHEQQDHTPDIYRASTLPWQPPCDDVTSSSRPTTEDGVKNTGLCTPRVFFYQANVWFMVRRERRNWTELNWTELNWRGLVFDKLANGQA